MTVLPDQALISEFPVELNDGLLRILCKSILGYKLFGGHHPFLHEERHLACELGPPEINRRLRNLILTIQ